LADKDAQRTGQPVERRVEAERCGGILLALAKGLRIERSRAIRQQTRHQVGDAGLPGRIAGGAAGERKGERHHGRALVLDQPGLDAERGS
jgi:hypothetical protein